MTCEYLLYSETWQAKDSGTITPYMKLFYSYSSVDDASQRELEIHLSLLKREGLLDTWSFRDIEAGNDWQRKIDVHLDSADLTLLLVSPHFMASRYCWEIEMTRAVERAVRQQTILVPVIIRPCDWQTAPFARFQALPENAKPISAWRPRDLGWANVASGIRRLITPSSRAADSSNAAPHEPRGLRSEADTIEYARQIAHSVVEHKTRRPQEKERGGPSGRIGTNICRVGRHSRKGQRGCAGSILADHGSRHAVYCSYN